MDKVLKLRHKNSMLYTREYFLLEFPKETTMMLYTVFLLVILCIVIIVFGKVDEVVKASGIVRTKENVSAVENVIGGKIIEIAYVRGQKINKGDLLYKIDSTVYDSQLETMRSERNDIQQKVKGAYSLKLSYDAGKNLCDEKDKVSYSRFESFLKSRQELEIRTELARQAYFIEKEKPEIFVSQAGLKQRKLEYDYALTSLSSYDSSFIEHLDTEIYEYTLALSKSEERINQMETQYQFLNVFAPVDGYIQEVSAMNIGDYMEAGRHVINIVPNDEKNFRVEILVAAKDMGKIKVGQNVKYRLSAFPYFEYQGALGKVTAIDPDSRNKQSIVNAGTTTKLNGASGVFYCVYADIDRNQFSNRKGDIFPIKAGLETNARIILERNTVLMFILKKMDFLY